MMAAMIDLESNMMKPKNLKPFCKVITSYINANLKNFKNDDVVSEAIYSSKYRNPHLKKKSIGSFFRKMKLFTAKGGKSQNIDAKGKISKHDEHNDSKTKHKNSKKSHKSTSMSGKNMEAVLTRELTNTEVAPAYGNQLGHAQIPVGPIIAYSGKGVVDATRPSSHQ